MADTGNIDIGPCSVKLDGVDLGHTKDGVVVKYEPQSVPLYVDQYGKTEIERALLGESLMVECNLAEITENNVNVATTHSTKSTSGGNTMVAFGATAGAFYSEGARVGQLILHPLKRESNDLSHDLTIYKAIVDDSWEMKFAADEQKVLKVTFRALIDEGKPVGKRLGHYGTHIS